jgi:hypothetical protein
MPNAYKVFPHVHHSACSTCHRRAEVEVPSARSLKRMTAWQQPHRCFCCACLAQVHLPKMWDTFLLSEVQHCPFGDTLPKIYGLKHSHYLPYIKRGVTHNICLFAIVPVLLERSAD